MASGKRCWLLRTDAKGLSVSVRRWLRRVAPEAKKSATCKYRKIWYRYSTPLPSPVLYSSAFHGSCPKLAVNTIGARAVGTIHGVRIQPGESAADLARRLTAYNFADRLLCHQGGLRKLDVNQMSAVVWSMLQEGAE